ncbi:SGNH/GDSL hydrolase family protein [Rubellimicrobium aerolatum]|uniref:SGNH/GDSL hydrolase family protein n=1 Tax=Rubellimicrobium aerolatum TaxID=490979 RepID=A0ABW0SC31_9RHOB|nr:SGNH/GDSL hydrolase family protein [Rubellimicrobium aerolatum]MBP1806224.1 hypothetical protein [Rubellimicrobium aerolatum]
MRIVAWGLAGALGLLVGGEAVARLVLGLGTPPLSMAHPTIEYLFRPGQDVMRFGNRQTYNEVGMRSGPLPRDGTPVILVVGDSIVNGGSETDQAELATEILRRDLSGNGRPAFVGNVSAGSWGPANQLAYLREFGTSDAEAVILVLSSHDASDVPAFAPLDPATHPTRTPPLALWEAVTRYLPRYLPDLGGGTAAETKTPAPGAALGDLAALVGEVRAKGLPLCAAHHWTEEELGAGLTEDGRLLAAALAETGVPVVDGGPGFEAALAVGGSPYRADGLHPSVEGQAILADLLRGCLERLGVAGAG